MKINERNKEKRNIKKKAQNVKINEQNQEKREKILRENKINKIKLNMNKK